MNPEFAELETMEHALRASRDELWTILETVADGVLVQDAEGRIVYANDAAARLCGFPSAAVLLAAPLSEVLDKFEIAGETGEPLARDQLPAQRAFRGEEAPAAVLRVRVIATGDESWSTVQARPIRDADGTVRRVVSAFQNVTPFKLAERREHLLNQAGALLAESLDYDTTLASIAELAVPQLADWAMVDLLQPDGTIRRVGLAHTDPAKTAWAWEFVQRYPADPSAPSGVPYVLRSGRPVFYPEIPVDLATADRVDDQLRRILQAWQPTSCIIVPLQARGRTLGAMLFVFAESRRHYTAADLALAQSLADRAAIAVDNARLYRDAQEALTLRDQFLASISHDLRTPLTTLRGLSQLALRRLRRLDSPEAEQIAQSLRGADRSAVMMDRMIDELLDLSRIESGRPLELERLPTDVVALARRLASDYQNDAPALTIRLETDLPALEGVWDPVRVERVLTNLLSNAIKYSPDGGTIVAGVGRDSGPDGQGDWARISVRDEGIGIPARDLPFIFDRFHRGSNVPDDVQGMGLGLAGARQITEQHGGTLTAESSQGQGSLFIVRLPLSDAGEQEE